MVRTAARPADKVKAKQKAASPGISAMASQKAIPVQRTEPTTAATEIAPETKELAEQTQHQVPVLAAVGATPATTHLPHLNQATPSQD